MTDGLEALASARYYCLRFAMVQS